MLGFPVAEMIFSLWVRVFGVVGKAKARQVAGF
jgi:hypothetical protein